MRYKMRVFKGKIITCIFIILTCILIISNILIPIHAKDIRNEGSDEIPSSLKATTLGIGGGGMLFDPSISPFDENTMIVLPDMGGVFIILGISIIFIIRSKKKYAGFLYKIKKLQKKYPNRIDNCNLVDYFDLKFLIEDYQNEELWSLCYGFVAVRPNGDLSFSTELGDPYIWGKAFENLYIPVDDKLMEYITKLKSADYKLLEFAKKEILEYDVELAKEVLLQG